MTMEGPQNENPEQSNNTEEQIRITESADKITLTTKIKRGERTRDEDRIKVKVKANDPEEAAAKLHQTVLAIGNNNTVNALRGTQPSSDSE